MNDKLNDIKSKIIQKIIDGENADKVIHTFTSNLSYEEKIELKILYENNMRDYRLNAENWLNTNLTFPLDEILKSRLFVYPVSDEHDENSLYSRILLEYDESNESYESKMEVLEKSPLVYKIERWETLEEQGGIYAYIYNDIEKRNLAIYNLADKVARNNQCNIDLGIYISNLDKHILKYTSNLDILSGLHLRYSIPQKNILVWDTLTCAENLGGTTSETFGHYRISCKFQWEILNRTAEPEVGYVQIEENDDPENLGDSFSPIFVELINDVNDLDKKLDLLYNKLHDIRQTNDKVTD